MEKLNQELIKIQKVDLYYKVKSKLLTTQKENKITTMRKICYLLMGIFFVVGLIFILVGAFFQNNKQKPIMIILIVIGVIFWLGIVIVAFLTNIKIFNFIKKEAKKNINSNTVKELYLLLGTHLEYLNISNIEFIDKYINFKFFIDQVEYKFSSNNSLIEIYDKSNNLIYNQESNKYCTYELVYKINILDTYKQGNIDNFVEYISEELKNNYQEILKIIFNFLNNKVKNENN